MEGGMDEALASTRGRCKSARFEIREERRRAAQSRSGDCSEDSTQDKAGRELPLLSVVLQQGLEARVVAFGVPVGDVKCHLQNDFDPMDAARELIAEAAPG